MQQRHPCNNVAYAAALGHVQGTSRFPELDVAVTRALAATIAPVHHRSVRARHRRRPGRHDDVRWWMALPCRSCCTGGLAVIGAVRGHGRDHALGLPKQGRHLGGIVGVTLGQHMRGDLARVGVGGKVQLAPSPQAIPRRGNLQSRLEAGATGRALRQPTRPGRTAPVPCCPAPGRLGWRRPGHAAGVLRAPVRAGSTSSGPAPSARARAGAERPG